MKLSHIIGQRELKDYFRRAFSGERLSHAYIIEGERGSGKRLLAAAAANLLVCGHSEAGESCGSCADCLQLAGGNHPDVIYVQPTKKTGYGAEDIRQSVLQEIDIRPYQSRYKIYIIASAESMTVQAQNVLLKTIEEPPAYALFFLLVENKDRLLETVLSRCVLLRMKPLSPEEMQELLNRSGRQEAQGLISFAEGNPGRLLELAASEDFGEMKRDLENLLDRFIKTSEHGIMEWIPILEKYEEKLEEALTTLQVAVRERLQKAYRQESPVWSGDSPESLHRYYFLARNLIRAKKQLFANVNKTMIIWNLFLF